MAKIRFSAIAGAIILLLTSCFGGSRADMLTKEDDSGQADARLIQILDAISNKDRGAIEAMFSEDALADAVDLDAGIDYLFAVFHDGIDSWERSSGSVSDSVNNGHKSVRSNYVYDVYTGENQYAFSIVEQTVETDHPEKVGVYSIKVINREAKMIRFGKAGIYVPEEYSDN